MAMTLRLTDEEQAALRQRAEREGISMQDAARRAVRDYVAKGEHRDRVAAAAERGKTAHAEALERLGEGPSRSNISTSTISSSSQRDSLVIHPRSATSDYSDRPPPAR